MIGDKFRFRFSKSGTLRLVSHHDLMRVRPSGCFAARLFRSNRLPVSPTPTFSICTLRALGVVCHDEVAGTRTDPTTRLRRGVPALNEQAPPGLVFTRSSVVPMKTTARAAGGVRAAVAAGTRFARGSRRECGFG